jgi:nucleoside-diphosphate-sugar epimerase
MRIVVIGGRGFVGGHVCAALARDGHDVVPVGREDPPRDGDVAIHLALYSENQAQEAMRRLRERFRRLVVASSGDVYRAYGWIMGLEPEAPPPGPIAEDAPLRTVLYPHGREARAPSGTIVDYEKILVEKVVLEAGATVLRLPKVFGPGDRARTFGPWVGRIQAREPILVGERVARWRWTHGYVEDVARAIALAATRPAGPGTSYNVGEEVTPTFAERAVVLADLLQGRVEVVPDAEVPADLALPIVHSFDLAYDTRRVRKDLGYAEVVSPDEAIARTAAWLMRTSS